MANIEIGSNQPLKSVIGSNKIIPTQNSFVEPRHAGHASAPIITEEPLPCKQEPVNPNLITEPTEEDDDDLCPKNMTKKQCCIHSTVFTLQLIACLIIFPLYAIFMYLKKGGTSRQKRDQRRREKLRKKGRRWVKLYFRTVLPSFRAIKIIRS